MEVEDWVEHCAEVCDSVEFLHGVPVKLPSETKALLRGRVRKALTTYAQQIREERDREVVEMIGAIDFYGWDINTQRMIKDKIINSLKK